LTPEENALACKQKAMTPEEYPQQAHGRSPGEFLVDHLLSPEYKEALRKTDQIYHSYIEQLRAAERGTWVPCPCEAVHWISYLTGWDEAGIVEKINDECFYFDGVEAKLDGPDECDISLRITPKDGK
jgi:hypothetical protein